MAAEYMAQYGVNLDAIIKGTASDQPGPLPAISTITNTHLAGHDPENLFTVSIRDGVTGPIEPFQGDGLKLPNLTGVVDGQRGLLAPSLCHAHVHLDKCFLLQDDKFADLEIVQGDFAEAMSLTGQAKQRFEEDDLLRRGQRLIEESITAGVTVMRAFVEVDEVAELKSLNAAIKLKEQFKDRCHVQICAFAQLAVFDDDLGSQRRKLMEDAVAIDAVEATGSTPYVEQDEGRMKQCVRWTIELAVRHHKHLDFHLDYNIDPDQEPLVWYAIAELRRQQWSENASKIQTICFGHCTRLTLFSQDDWRRLRQEIGDLPISFVGLPTSDLFMMGRPESTGSQRPRATLQLPEMVKQYDLNCAMSINNIGNAFTPWGPVDPVALASLGMGVYQTGSKQDAELLYELVSTRAKTAIGVGQDGHKAKEKQAADFVLFIPPAAHPDRGSRTLADVVYGLAPQTRRMTIRKGKSVEAQMSCEL